jgi:xanthine permease XanP
MTQSNPNLAPPPTQEPVSEPTVPSLFGDLLYGLDDKPPVPEALFVALQHVLASFVGIITPPLIISNALGASPEVTGYIISISLFVSGVATFIQCRRFGPVGSGLLSLQGTSFAFLGPVIGVGTAEVAAGRSPSG